MRKRRIKAKASRATTIVVHDFWVNLVGEGERRGTLYRSIMVIGFRSDGGELG